jgi:branched-chain amino acid transport system permease protein
MENNRSKIAFGIVLVILPLIFINQTFLISIFSQVLIFSIAAFGLNILIGFAGQISIGHASFIAIGAYLSAILTKNFHIPFIVTVFLSGGLSGLFGLVLGFPALRLKGFYLAIATMAFGVMIEQLLGSWSYVNGHIGMRDIPNFDLFGYTLKTDLGKYYVIAFCTFVLFLIGFNFLKSRTGRALKAIRESEFAARSSGVNVAKYKLIAFVLSAIYAGIAGSLYAHTINYIAPSDFGLSVSINLLAMIVVGGLASFSGNFIGSILMIALPFLFSRTNLPLSVIFGTMLVIVVLFFPKGLGYGLQLLSLKYFGIPFAWVRRMIRRSKIVGGKEMFVKSSSGKIHYEIGGNPQGKPLFMVHGNFGSWRWFKPVMDRLDKTPFRGVALDLPGFGDSDKPLRDISIENYAKELSEFLDAFKEEKINLIGHSLGGAVIWDYATKHPGKLGKILLIDPAPADGLITPEEYYPALALYRNNRDLLKKALAGTIPSGDPDKILESLVNDAMIMDTRAFTQNARALEHYNYSEELGKITRPVLILYGEKDLLITEKLLASTLSKLPSADIRKLPVVGHSVIVENPDLAVQIIKEFFGS